MPAFFNNSNLGKKDDPRFLDKEKTLIRKQIDGSKNLEG
jgi:hypothetical protein